MSAVVSALLEPAVALLMFAAVWAAAQREPSRADQVLLLLWLALTIPSPDLLGRPLVERISEGVVGGVLAAAVLGLCGWATRSLHLVDARLWAVWVLATGVAHQLALSAAGWMWRHLWSRPPRRVAVLGAGPMGIRVARALRRMDRPRSEDELQFVGWFDPRWGDGDRGKPLRRGGLPELTRALRQGHLDEVFVALERTPAQVTARWWDALQDSTAEVHVVPEGFGSILLQGRVQTLEGLPVVSPMASPFTGLNAVVKRLEDTVVAGVAVLLLWPLMLAIALWIKWDSPGPVLFRQARLGLGGRVIEVWKFRTLRESQTQEIRQVAQGDARVTRAGRILRRTSLDELPQFFNVLQGRMSVVGPRPHALSHNEQYRGLVRAYMWRHKVRPGLTGWAQVNGLRGPTETVDKMRRRIEHDLDYLRHWSLALDLQIILRTAGLVFRDAHAW